MADFTIIVTGDEEIAARLARLRNAEQELRTPMQRSVEKLRAELALYPPPPEGSTYRRTGTLGRRWLTSISGLVGKAYNTTVYAPYVQDEEQQAGVHRGRWQTVQSVGRKLQEEIMADLMETIARLLNG